MEDIFYFIILCFYLHYRHLCFNTNVLFLCFVFWSSWLLFFFLSFVYPGYYIKDHIYCWEVFCSLGTKDMMFQRRQDSNRMLWSVRNAEFVERGNWRLGRDGLGVMEKIGKNCDYWCHCHCIGLKVKTKVALSRIYWFCLAHRVLVLQ